MINNRRNKKVSNFALFLFVLLISSTLVSLLLNSFTNFNIYDNYDYQTNLKINDFSKEDYEPIFEEKKQSLGNITVYNMNFDELEIGQYIYNASYPILWEDYNTGALIISFKEMKYIETIEGAHIDNLNEDILDRKEITVKLNETLKFWYDNPQEGYLIYRPRLYPSYLANISVFDGDEVLELTKDTDYYIDSRNFLVFDYENYFKKASSNFTMYIIWEYDLTLNPWRLRQLDNNNLIMNKAEQNFTVKFNYAFILTGQKFNESSNQKIPAENVGVAMNVYLPDKDLIGNHSLSLNEIAIPIESHLNFDNSINISLSDSFFTDENEFSLNFTTRYSIKFLEPVYKTWAIDRLVALRNIRERIYFPSVIDGPSHIYLSFISIYELSILSGETLSNNSLFERDVLYFEENVTDNRDIRLRIELPYMFVGEICPFSITYRTVTKLRIIVTDNIKMPILGLKLRIYYYDIIYGTYISINRTQPIAPLKTNENGEVILNNVPNGNYTVEVYQYGNLIIRTDVSTYNEINYIYTSIIHIPIWISIFGAVNGFILIIGIIYYLKNKRPR